jgi:nucleotide-binding universal stress UspA family protein
MLPFRTLLHPTDFSELSAHALGLAARLAQDYDARLILLHVVAPPIAAYAEGDVLADLHEISAAMREQLNEVPVPRPEGTVERRVVQGDPVTEILRAATEAGADLIVMGASGRSGLERLLLGDVADQVLRRTTCPLLVTRGPVPERAPGQAAADQALELCRP